MILRGRADVRSRSYALKGRDSMLTIRELKPGDMFTLRPIECPKDTQVYIRREYDRECRKYRADRFDDISIDRLLKPSTPVYIDFDF